MDVYWIDERDLTVLAEGRKTQSSLLRAQQVAKEMYDACLVRSCSQGWYFMQFWELRTSGGGPCDKAVGSTISNVSRCATAVIKR